jgi:hypothetical protein
MTLADAFGPSQVCPVATETGRPLTVQVLRIAPAALVLAALFIDVAFGRWGAYIRTPIPGLYLPDAMFLIGALCAAPMFGALRSMPKAVRIAFAVLPLYVVVRAVFLLFSPPLDEPYLAIRDLAPFCYLALVPLIALALTAIRFSWLLWALRVATLIHLAGVALVSFGLVTQFTSAILGQSSIAVLEYRSDLQGVIFGIGLLAWGTWPGSVAGSRLVQLLFLFVGLGLSSRSALISFAFCLAVAAVRERRSTRPGYVLLALVACFIVLVGTAQMNSAPLPSAPLPSDAPSSWVPGGVAKLLAVQGAGQGTMGARTSTYTLVLSAVSRDGFWLLGSGPGTDALYTICTGIPEAPTRVTTLNEGVLLVRPKCPVDDADAATTLRDPHQWLLNLLIYNGLAGTLVFLMGLLVPLWAYRKSPHAILPIAAICAYFVCGSFGVIISSPFGMLPVAVMLAWMISSAGALAQGPRWPSPDRSIT